VISSPGRTGARNFQETSRKTLPGPGSCSATSAFSSPEVTPPWTTMPPCELVVVVDRVAIPRDLGEQVDVSPSDGTGTASDLAHVECHASILL